ncbi:MAG: sigma-70 family RNA polymerase sigma factor [Myxococcaceae bacterium]
MSLDATAARLTAAHPEWKISAARFLPRLTEAVESAGSLEAINAEDLLLAFAALAKVPTALAEVDRRIARISAAVAAKFREGDQFGEELLQKLRVKILVGSERTGPALGQYQGEGALVAWFKVVASSTAVDLRRSRRPERTDQGNQKEERLERFAAAALPADEALAHGRHKQAITAALKESLELIDDESRVLLRLRFVDGLSVEDAAQTLGVHRTTALRRIEKIQQDLLSNVREILKRRLRLASRDLDSLLRSFRPSLNERLSRLIRRPSFE